MMNEAFRDNVVLLTGASSGIGRELALQLAAQGARLTLAARTGDKLQEVAAGCRERGGTAQVVAIKQGEKYVESRVAERNRDHALFIAYAPADDPKIAMAILVENGGHGGSVAGPIARTVLDYFLLGKLPPPPAPPVDEEEVEHD